MNRTKPRLRSCTLRSSDWPARFLEDIHINLIELPLVSEASIISGFNTVDRPRSQCEIQSVGVSAVEGLFQNSRLRKAQGLAGNLLAGVSKPKKAERVEERC